MEHQLGHGQTDCVWAACLVCPGWAVVNLLHFQPMHLFLKARMILVKTVILIYKY